MSTAPGGDARAFEAALRDNPDDLAGWCAYADWLTEQGDPRGEFMQVQLALEDESRPKDERAALKEQERELLEAHERNWLGELAPFLLDQPTDEPDPFEPIRAVHQWHRGFVSELLVGALSTAFARALANAPAARMLQVLRIHDANTQRDREGPVPDRARNPQGIEYYSPLFELLGSECLYHLRVFQVGPDISDESTVSNDRWSNSGSYTSWTYVRGLEHVIESMSRIEELHLYCKQYNLEAMSHFTNLTNLRVLRVYHLGRDSSGRRERSGYPLDVLATNPAFANLTHLLFHPHHEEGGGSFLPLDQLSAVLRSEHLTNLTHLQFRLSDMGDDGAHEIVDSGALKRLKWLDLRHGCITDEGAKVLAACPDIRNLEHLDLSRNVVTGVGLNLLKQTGISVRADFPLSEAELAEQVYLCEGDFE